MKKIIVLILISFLLNQTIGYTQKVDSTQTTSKDFASFVTIFDKNNATKDGYYLNGYVVNIKHELGQQLHIKKIKVSGKITIVKGINDQESGEIKQGREKDTKHILKPTIEIIE